METVKVIIDGKEVEMAISLDPEYYEVNHDLENKKELGDNNNNTESDNE